MAQEPEQHSPRSNQEAIKGVTAGGDFNAHVTQNIYNGRNFYDHLYHEYDSEADQNNIKRIEEKLLQIKFLIARLRENIQLQLQSFCDVNDIYEILNQIEILSSAEEGWVEIQQDYNEHYPNAALWLRSHAQKVAIYACKFASFKYQSTSPSIGLDPTLPENQEILEREIQYLISHILLPMRNGVRPNDIQTIEISFAFAPEVYIYLFEDIKSSFIKENFHAEDSKLSYQSAQIIIRYINRFLIDPMKRLRQERA